MFCAVTRNPGVWSEWVNMDNPRESDQDDESLKKLRKRNPDLCDGNDPVGIFCRTANGRPWYEARQVLRRECTLEYGLLCVNSDNNAPGNGTGCLDYEIEVSCLNQAPSP